MWAPGTSELAICVVSAMSTRELYRTRDGKKPIKNNYANSHRGVEVLFGNYVSFQPKLRQEIDLSVI